MTKVFASCLLSGSAFDPSNALRSISKLSFTEAHPPGAISKYTKQILEHGGAIINHPSNLGKTGKKIAWEDMLAFLRKHHQTLRACGVEDINLTLNFFYPGDGASWHIEAEDIQALSQLGIGLSIDWYQIAEEQVYAD